MSQDDSGVVTALAIAVMASLIGNLVQLVNNLRERARRHRAEATAARLRAQ